MQKPTLRGAFVAACLAVGIFVFSSGSRPLFAADPCPGDIDCSGAVDGSDLAFMAQDFGNFECSSIMPGVPVGFIGMWYGQLDVDGHPLVNGAPDAKWVVCDGNNDTPDLRDRFIVGAGGNYNFGEVGGAKNAQLNVANLPSHQHTLDLSTDCTTHQHADPGDRTDFWIGGLVPTTLMYPGDAGWRIDSELPDSVYPPESRCEYSGYGLKQPGHQHMINGATNATGSGTPAENRPPFYAVYFIMKVAP